METALTLSFAIGMTVAAYLLGRNRARSHAADVINCLEIDLMQERLKTVTQDEKLAWLQSLDDRTREAFEALAGQVLRSTSDDLVKRSRESLEGVLREVRGDWQTQKAEISSVVDPVRESLASLDTSVRQMERNREGAYRGLEAHLTNLARAHTELQTSTTTLSQALKSSSVRGRWGELQLRRIVQLAGMAAHVDFDEQVGDDSGGRPDMVIHLPNGGILPVDAKTPMEAYLSAVEAGSEEDRAGKLDEHVKAVYGRIRDLGRKAYWEQFERAPECVVMFIPVEASLGAAYDRDAGLFERAIKQNVLIGTPVTLLALLKAVAFGWQERQVTENARKIADEGRELYTRLATFLGHLSKLGDTLSHSVEGYNRTVASLQARVLPSVKRFQELGVSTSDAPEVVDVEGQPRRVGGLVEEGRGA